MWITLDYVVVLDKIVDDYDLCSNFQFRIPGASLRPYLFPSRCNLYDVPAGLYAGHGSLSPESEFLSQVVEQDVLEDVRAMMELASVPQQADPEQDLPMQQQCFGIDYPFDEAWSSFLFILVALKLVQRRSYFIQREGTLIKNAKAEGLNARSIVLLIVIGLLLIFLVSNYALYMYAQTNLPPRKKKPPSQKKLKRDRFKQGLSAPGEGRIMLLGIRERENQTVVACLTSVSKWASGVYHALNNFFGVSLPFFLACLV
ncbi:DNA binding protein S1FA [Parasponia andersonii]|uniref:DNA binding protein S1FA n=1 Tax=Parasponia andersonii TaxID=3476 RepID=A0A2P5AFK5_PARAD|nr:DNA binding protein S1FA [Parasponia andersonii]